MPIEFHKTSLGEKKSVLVSLTTKKPFHYTKKVSMMLLESLVSHRLTPLLFSLT